MIACVSSPSAPTSVPEVKSHVRNISISIDTELDNDGFSPSEFGLEFVAGASLWEPLGGLVTIDPNAHMRVMCATWSMDLSAATTNSAGIAIDCLYFYGLKTDSRVHLMAHEIGHAFGLLHVGQLDAIMYPHMNNTDVLTAADVAEWERTE